MKLSEFLSESTKHVIDQWLEKNHLSFLHDMYEWKDMKTMKVLVPDNSDYLIKTLHRIPFKHIKPVYDVKKQEITFVKK